MAEKIKNIECKTILLGFIDDYKCGKNVFRSDCYLDEDAIILYVSHPRYHLECITSLKKNKIKNKIYDVNLLQYKINYTKHSLKRKKIFCFGNCQAEMIAQYINIFGVKDYIASAQRNYIKIDQTKIIELMKQADIIIYQPLSIKYGKLSYQNIQTISEKYNKLLITFPYIYNDGLHSLEYDGNLMKFKGDDIIKELVRKNYSKDMIYNLYENNKIDFKLQLRFKNSMKILEQKENVTNIKISNFIKKNYQKNNLFFGYDHPTSVIFIEIINQINKFLISPIKINLKNNLPELSNYLAPISKYDIQIHKYTFMNNYLESYHHEQLILGNLIISKILCNIKEEMCEIV